MAKPKPVELDIEELRVGRIKVHLLGKTPFIHHAMAQKAWEEFLLPKGKRTTDADRRATLKHDPMAEYRDSAYYMDDPQAATLLAIPAAAFKGCMATAALDLPGARKTEIGRLCWVQGVHVCMWGVPQIYLDIVRQADLAHTPDVRTRAAVRDWCAEITIEFARPKLTEKAIVNLLVAGGMTCGVGDGRQEKGKLNYGQFTPISRGDAHWADYERIQKTGGRKAQTAAIAQPEPFDTMSAKLLTWYPEELRRRGRAHEQAAATDAKVVPIRRRGRPRKAA